MNAQGSFLTSCVSGISEGCLLPAALPVVVTTVHSCLSVTIFGWARNVGATCCGNGAPYRESDGGVGGGCGGGWVEGRIGIKKRKLTLNKCRRHGLCLEDNLPPPPPPLPLPSASLSSWPHTRTVKTLWWCELLVSHLAILTGLGAVWELTRVHMAWHWWRKREDRQAGRLAAKDIVIERKSYCAFSQTGSWTFFLIIISINS